MRPDQIAQLQELSEKLADSFIFEADPAQWPGKGTAPADMTTQERGNAYWCKRNAMATGGVLRYALDLLEQQGGQGPLDSAERDADMDRKIKDAEQRAARAVARVIGKAKGPTHGKQPS